MDMIRKVVTCEAKQVGDRVLEFIGSTETVDRDGEVIKASGWDTKNYQKNPVFMWAHNYHDPPIGKAQKVWVEDSQLKFQIEFADKETYPFADTIFRLYNGGFLKATSVGFIPDEDAIENGDGEKKPRRTYGKQELLELSAVPVPSNPDALVQAYDAKMITKKEMTTCQKAFDEAVTKPEETEDYFRVPIPGEEGKHEGHRIRTMDISEEKGIKALYCGECKKIITYLFSKEEKYGWTMESAEAWVREHSRATTEALIVEDDVNAEVLTATMNGAHLPASITEAVGNTVVIATTPQAKDISQTEIKDEFDYVKSIIANDDLNDENRELAWEIVREIMRLSGDDMPVDIQVKVGAVLNRRNKDNLKQAQGLIQEVLDSAEAPEEEGKPKGITKTEASEYIRELLAKHIQ